MILEKNKLGLNGKFYLNQHLRPNASLALYVLEYGAEQLTQNLS